MSQELPDVRRGQVWEDNDPRSAGRQLLIELVMHRPDEEPYALCRSPHSETSRRSRIKFRRFRPNSTGYRLVRDVPKENPR